MVMKVEKKYDVVVWSEPAWSTVAFSKSVGRRVVQSMLDGMSYMDTNADGYFKWRNMWLAVMDGRREWPTGRDGRRLKAPSRAKLSWDGRVRFMKPASPRVIAKGSGMWRGSAVYRLPTGLLGEMMRLAHAMGLDVYVDGPRHPVKAGEISEEFPDGTRLRPYQVEAARKMMEARRGICRVATGGGKTEIMIAVIRSLLSGLEPGKRILVLVHMKEIFNNVVNRINTRINEPVCRFGMGYDEVVPGSRLLVASVPAIWRRRKSPEVKRLLDSTVAFIADEVHHVQSARTWESILMSCDAPIRMGFTATTLMEDEMSIEEVRLSACTGGVVVDIDAGILVREGYLSRPVVHMVRVNSRDEALMVPATIMRDCPGLSGMMVVCRKIKEGEIINRALSDVGVSSRFVKGETSADDREEAKMELERGSIRALVSTTIMKEGTDIPSVKVLVNLLDEARHRSVVQVIGRSLRIPAGKSGDGMLPSVVHIVDPVVGCDGSAVRRAMSRVKACLAEGFEVMAHASSKRVGERITEGLSVGAAESAVVPQA